MNTSNNQKIDKVHITIQYTVLFATTLFAFLLPFLFTQEIFPEGFSKYAHILSVIFQFVFSLYFFFQYLKTNGKRSLLFSFIFLLLIIFEAFSFSGSEATLAMIISKGILLLFILLGIVLPKHLFFSKQWFFQDINFWRLFSFVFLLISSFYLVLSQEGFSLWTQLVSYIALLMGYGNEVRNDLIQKRK